MQGAIQSHLKLRFWNRHFSKRLFSLFHLKRNGFTAAIMFHHNTRNTPLECLHHSDHTPDSTKQGEQGNFGNAHSSQLAFLSTVNVSTCSVVSKQGILPPHRGSASSVSGWGRHSPWRGPSPWRWPSSWAWSPSRGVTPVTIKNSNEKQLSNFQIWGNWSSEYWV